MPVHVLCERLDVHGRRRNEMLNEQHNSTPNSEQQTDRPTEHDAPNNGVRKMSTFCYCEYDGAHIAFKRTKTIYTCRAMSARRTDSSDSDGKKTNVVRATDITQPSNPEKFVLIGERVLYVAEWWWWCLAPPRPYQTKRVATEL